MDTVTQRKTHTSAAVKNRYNSKTYDRIEIVVKKGDKDIIKQKAASKGMSVSEYITGLIYSDLDK